MLHSLLNRKRIYHDVLFALKWKRPANIEVYIQKTEDGYFAKVVNLDDNVVTQAKTGLELFEMVNDAMYEYLDIPTQYRESLGYFMPSDDVRQEFKIEIPDKYLNKNLGLVTA